MHCGDMLSAQGKHRPMKYLNVMCVTCVQGRELIQGADLIFVNNLRFHEFEAGATTTLNASLQQVCPLLHVLYELIDCLSTC